MLSFTPKVTILFERCLKEHDLHYINVPFYTQTDCERSSYPVKALVNSYQEIQVDEVSTY